MPTMLQDATFISNGNRIVAEFHLPDDPRSEERLPGIVVVGPVTSVKGQVPTIYAERLAALGYAALAFDHSTYGESEGWPRSDEDLFAKIEDIKNAVTFLAGHDHIDADRLAAVGVCAGGGNVPASAVADRPIQAVAPARAITDLRAEIKAAGDDWRSIMVAADNAREEYARSGRPMHIPFLADGQLDVWRENAKKFYFTDRNHDPNWRNETLLWSYDKMIQFSAIDTAGLLTPTPLLVIAGSQAETLEHSERLYEHAQEAKELHVIEGGTHFDFYDRPQYVGPAITKITEFFTNHH